MKIVLDLQGCQSASRFRGIGRYSLALAKAVIRNRGVHSIKLMLNGLYADGLDELRQQFQDDVSTDDILVFDAEGPVAEFDTTNTGRARLAELARERLIHAIDPDVVLMTSLFEGFVDDAVTSVGLLGDGPFTAVTLYDLIPYLSPDPNWPAHYKSYYDLKIQSLKRADLLLSISDYARQECAGALPELDGRVVNMSSACDSMFRLGESTPGELDALLKKFDIAQPFVMSAGSLESRKNFAQLIRAFGAMPAKLRTGRQIVLVGGADADKIKEITHIAAESGLEPHQLHVLGHVTDEELLGLYRACELFVFPSLHEGFGLPPLEAMACGAVVLGSNTTSVPEVIGRKDAMFDPTSIPQLCDLMIKALTDEDFRQSLRQHAARQAAEFSWDKTAQCAIRAIEAGVHQQRARVTQPRESIDTKTIGKPRVAIVSPLPPERTGIADYVAELLPTLGETYDITVISDQDETWPATTGEQFVVKKVAWFEKNATLFDRVVYQVGNSPFHAHMLDLMKRHPGVVVLHDFFISSLILWMDVTGYSANAMKRTLERSHGYGALEFLAREGTQAAKFGWPCSYDVVSNALGVVVHSDYSRDLACKFYGDAFAEKIRVVRQHRTTIASSHAKETRRNLGFAEDDFVVCAFGFMDYTKLNHVLLEAWSRSSLAMDVKCKLVFVGGKDESEYGQRIDETIASIEGGSHISFTGFVDHKKFVDHLSVVDVAVQLRTLSRGETSRTVLDCLAHGVSLIVNAHGPMAEYPDDTLIKLEDEFKVEDLVNALERLRNDAALRAQLAVRGPAYIEDNHEPHKTAAGYAAVIESTVESAALQGMKQTAERFWKQFPDCTPEVRDEAAQKATDLIFSPVRPRIYLDVSATVRNDLKTGIERVARSLLREMLLSPPEGYQVVPVYLAQENGLWRVRQANSYLSRQPGFGLVTSADELVIPAPGDILMGLDLFTDGVVAATRQGLYTYWRAAGAKVGFMVFDLLPVSHPHFFPPWAPAMHEAWIQAITSSSDILVCISEHVKTEANAWMDGRSIPTPDRPILAVSYLGADVEASFPTRGLPANAAQILDTLASRPTFLMVGTIEPRKGHLQALKSFERLWKQGVEANLVIVGYEGWKSLPDGDRRTIPEIMKTIRNSPQSGKRLFWLEGISDEYLERIYRASTCLIAASEDEGFGLPLIEAARHGLPVLARDIPVFREVGGESIRYFPAHETDGLIEAVNDCLQGNKNRGVRNRTGIEWMSWRESATNLSNAICADSNRV